jgi:multiple RNA-binding domain-containing protein 1
MPHSTAMEASSRIFVRGLPPTFTDDAMRKHFAKFPVTDVKFFPHRRIGYVGYKTHEDATKAVKHFNKTFIKLSKIYAELALPVCTHGHRRVEERG